MRRQWSRSRGGDGHRAGRHRQVRLAWEFEKYLDACRHRVLARGTLTVLRRGISTGPGPRWCEGPPRRDRRGRRQRPHPAPPGRRARRVQSLTRVSGAGSSHACGPAGRRGVATEGRRSSSRLADLLERMAAVGAVVMVFSDLQWADQGLLDFVEDLLHWPATSRSFVVASARPSSESGEAASARGADVTPSTRAAERRRDAAAARGLVPASHCPSPFDGARAEGIPLYAGKRAHAPRPEMLVATEGRYQLTGDSRSGRGGDAPGADRVAAMPIGGGPCLLLDASVLGRVSRGTPWRGGRVEPSDRTDRLEGSCAVSC